MILQGRRIEWQIARLDEKVAAMKANTEYNSTAERTGAVIGRAWRRWLRQEHRLIGWLVSKGLPATTAKTLLWIVTLAALAVLLYVALWLTLLLAFAFSVACAARNADWDEEDHQPEWRNGVSGFGLYTTDGYRIDPHNSDDD